MVHEIRSRRSTRKFNSQVVEDEKILPLIEAACLAPSGSNTQPWRFMIVKNQETKEEIARANHNQRWLKEAPIHIVCIADVRCRIKDERDVFIDESSDLFEVKQIIRDTAIATGYLLLEAESMGLSTCWTAWFKQKDIREILGIPDDKFVVGVVAVGYSDVTRKPTPRMAVTDVLTYEGW